MTTDINITRADTIGDLSSAAAAYFVDLAADAIAHRGRFVVALVGGSTPARLYQVLAAPPQRDAIDWGRVHAFWGDERMVAPDAPESNFRLAEQNLLSRVPIPDDHIHPIRTSLDSATDAAEAYDRELASFFGLEPARQPSFDLILLGLGSDGHTASLFPGSRALAEHQATATWSPPGVLPPPVDRVTLTLPALNAARAVAFLVAGEDKADAVRRVLEDGSDLPAARVRPTDGDLRWFLDTAATSQLRS